MTSQRPPVQRFAQHVTVWSCSEGGVLEVLTLGVRRVMEGIAKGSGIAPSESPYTTSKCLNIQSFALMPPFGRNSSVNCGLQFDPCLGVRMDLGDESDTN